MIVALAVALAFAVGFALGFLTPIALMGAFIRKVLK
ncbi:hypothetical protein KOAAANKH_00082 [Brevundimonas sp. NIBR10]|nr:hypothetical protein KOAAANKH_00082 [Brevundimonas sp. NIBR10]